jgi:hypothetical protein
MFQSAQRNFLSRTTRGVYRHIPVLSFNERQQYEALLRPAQQSSQKAVLLATQVQMQDKYRKRGWKLTDNLVHPFNPGHAKVYVKEGAVAVIYPDASVSRHQKVQVEYERGWNSPAERERKRVKTNEKLSVGHRRVPAPLNIKVLKERLMRALKGGR